MLIVLVAAAFAPVAHADGGPSPGVLDGWPGLAVHGVHYVADSAGRSTLVEVTRRSGPTLRARTVRGSFGIPLVTWGGDVGGLSADGGTLALQQPSNGGGLARVSRFDVLDARSLRTLRRIVLAGDFAYDALSPDGRTLYLVEHVSALDVTRYRVRAYDVAAGRLLPEIIADRTTWQTAMAGSPLSRASSADGGWVYTLYGRTDGHGVAFVHALDTRHRRAVCLDVPWHRNPQVVWGTRLRLDERRGTLTVFDRKTRETYAVLHVPAAALPSSTAGISSLSKAVLALVAGLLAGACVVAGGRRRRRAARAS
jgi:hypothetical protein